jgi:hypothetical protein
VLAIVVECLAISAWNMLTFGTCGTCAFEANVEFDVIPGQTRLAASPRWPCSLGPSRPSSARSAAIFSTQRGRFTLGALIAPAPGSSSGAAVRGALQLLG